MNEATGSRPTVSVKIQYWYSIDELNRGSFVVDDTKSLRMLMFYSTSESESWTLVDPVLYRLALVGYPEVDKEFEFEWARVVSKSTNLSKPLYWEFALPNGVVNYQELMKLKYVTDGMLTLNSTIGTLADAPGYILQWFNTVFPRPLIGYLTTTFTPTFIKRWNPYQRETLSEIGMECVYVYSAQSS